ncbi:NAD(P)-dependent oxidoreductase [Pseudanabaena sp. FACHB-1277]|uniref:NAD(P)-dependent oxidoreductase n=1 Tax=Pseudanabaena cinerea FACHB-1277 TaxID=2949581 RepID=A0A926UW63_9CYAN|nr:NAD(P)-dependent oxidoreductase [Pseudanabaena cinerea]MBD2151135.1 NAD(P)-dependent oxidoreductase [Pseudanabaena cinerea FACHB-1277]
MTNIAFLGLGIMGGSMAINIAKHNLSVTAWNRTAGRPIAVIATAAGVKIVETIEQAVTKADIVITCVSDVQDVRSILLGENSVATYAKQGTLIIDMSTIGSQAAREIANELQAKGLRFLDAPVSGGDIGAQNATLTIMVGGDRLDFEEALPIFQAMGKSITYCGESGSGQAIKLCNQLLCAINLASVCEAIEFAIGQGVDPKLVVEVCSTGAAGSWQLANLGNKIIDGDFAPGFAIKHMSKDLRLAKEALGENSKPLPAFELTSQLFNIVKAMDDGQGGEQGTHAIIRAYRE